MILNWKNSMIVLLDIAIAVYLLFAITVFNTPDDRSQICSKVVINILDNQTDGFLNNGEIKKLLEQKNSYPEGQPLSEVSVRKMEDILKKSPLVESVECYKGQDGKVYIKLCQRLPIIRIKSNNGDDYYIDNKGEIMPHTKYVSDRIIATGHIQKSYATKILAPIANELANDEFWQNQIEQINILENGGIELVPRVGDHIIYLGNHTHLTRKLERMRMFYKYGLQEAGWNKYSYISVEFDNQIICRKGERKESNKNKI